MMFFHFENKILVNRFYSNMFYFTTNEELDAKFIEGIADNEKDIFIQIILNHDKTENIMYEVNKMFAEIFNENTYKLTLFCTSPYPNEEGEQFDHEFTIDFIPLHERK